MKVQETWVDFIIHIPLLYRCAYLSCFLEQVNHDFRKNNSEYSNIEHPRWGATQGVRLTKNVKAGEEIFTFYGYEHGYAIPSDFPWYWELKRQVEKTLRRR